MITKMNFDDMASSMQAISFKEQKETKGGCIAICNNQYQPHMDEVLIEGSWGMWDAFEYGFTNAPPNTSLGTQSDFEWRVSSGILEMTGNSAVIETGY